MTQELAVIDTTAELVVRREPEVVLAEAQKVAASLMSVISNKTKKVMLNGEQYLELEDWQTAGRFYGVTPRVTRIEYVTYQTPTGQVCGFRACAEAVRADGFVLSSAEADCLNDEEKWRSKPRYDRQIEMTSGEWVSEPVDEAKYPKSAWKWLGTKDDKNDPRRPSSRRVKAADEPVPLFQLKSMAQTRACSKVLRNVLAWVVVLAGYRPTPAEELDGVPGVAEHVDRAHDPGQTASAAAGKAPTPTAKEGSSAASTAPAGAQTAGTQPAAPLAAGVTTVLSVDVTSGKKNNTAWTRHFAKFADGRQGVTFSDTLGKTLQEALAGKTPVNPRLEKTSKGWDLKELLPVVAPEPVHEDEPVTGPEKVLTVRKVDTDLGVRFIIQTDKRQLVSEKQEHADAAVAARSAKLGVTPKFEVVLGGSGQKVNRCLELVVEHAATPATEPEAEREPGSDG